MKNTKVMKRVCVCVCVCVCVGGYGLRRLEMVLSVLTRFVRSGNSAVSGVRSSVVRARGCWEVAVGGAPDVKFALCTVAGMVVRVGMAQRVTV